MRITTIICLSMFACSSISAIAQEPIVIKNSGKIIVSDDKVIRRVSYADLNLAAKEGQLTLTNRVKAAVQEVCTEGGWPDGKSECSTRAWNNAQIQMDDAIATAEKIALQAIKR